MTNATLSAVGIMATASLLVTVNDALVKEALRFAGTAEVLFFRGLFALAPFLVYALLRRRPEALLPRNIKLAFLLSVLAVLSLFTISLRFIPLASAITLAYLSPIMVALVSALLIGERIGPLQWIAALTGFAGVVAMTSPSLQAENWIILLPVLVAVTIAGRDIIIRATIAREHTIALVVWTHLLTIGITALAFDASWLRFDMRQFSLYAAAGITVSLGTAGMIAALRYASAASMSAVKYSCVLWAGLIGWLVFGERLSAGMIGGGILIVASGGIIAWHEARKSGQPDTAARPG
jgi:drug/metabolite transporter (DMT)-like permease